MLTQFQKADTDKIDVSVWERYEKTRDVALRNEILNAYLYIVTCSIRRMQSMSGSFGDVQDMTSHCVLELINCIDRYDYRRGVQFDSFASIRIRGSIIDYIRKTDWVPRDVRRRTRQLNDGYEALQNELGRAPEDAELAERLGIDETEVVRLRREEAGFNILAFEELLLENGPTLLDMTEDQDELSPEAALMEDEFTAVLARFIDELEEKERTVVSLYYYEELKLKEIAFVMGVTPSRVSQIHSKALARLRERIRGYLTE